MIKVCTPCTLLHINYPHDRMTQMPQICITVPSEGYIPSPDLLKLSESRKELDIRDKTIPSRCFAPKIFKNKATVHSMFSFLKVGF